MADEVRLSATLAYSDGLTNRVGMRVEDVVATVATPGALVGRMSVGVSQVALPIGTLTPRYVLMVNKSAAAQTITVATGVAGTNFATLKAGEAILIPLSSNVSAPAVQASAADAILEFGVCNT